MRVASVIFLVGMVISLVTVWGSSVFLARLNIIQAIRDLPRARSAKRRASRHCRPKLSVSFWPMPYKANPGPKKNYTCWFLSPQHLMPL